MNLNAIRIAVTISILILGAGCSGEIPGTANAEPTPTLTPRSLPAVSALARLEPKGELREVGPPTGHGNEPIARWLVSEGDRVSEGQLLAVLDSESLLQAQLTAARARVGQAQAALAQVEAGPKLGTVTRQRAEIDRLRRDRSTSLAQQDVTIRKARENEEKALKEFERYRNLYKNGATSESTKDQKEREYLSASLERQEAEKARRRLDQTLYSSITAAQGELAAIREVRPTDLRYAGTEIVVAQAEVARLEAELEKTRVYSPIDGTILEILTHAGEVSKDGILVEIGETDQMVAIAEVHQQDIARVELGQSAEVRSPALKSPAKGRVARIGQQVQRQRIFSNIPGENFDQRVVEVELELEMSSSPELKTLSNLQAETVIEVEP